MRPLSKIVGYLNLLESEGLVPDCQAAIAQLANISHTVSSHHLQYGALRDDLASDLEQVKTDIEKFQNTLECIKSKLREDIANREPEYYQLSTNLYEQEMIYETPEYILNRRLQIDDENNAAIRARIQSYSDWRLPGMILRPGHETFIEEMVPLDPLYVLDHHEDLIKPAIEKFTVEYQRRLRPYIINDRDDGEILKDLPDRQFGFIFAYNYLNYKPIEIVEKYLREFFKKLRNGGRLLFTYNDCDFPQGIGLAENNFMCYTPGKRVMAIIQTMGVEVIEHRIGPYNMAWMEVRRYGEIESLRAGQSLAKIHRK